MSEDSSSQISERAPFGALPDGSTVEKVRLGSEPGVTATILTLGASLQSVMVPDRDGARRDVLLGHSSLDEYLSARQYLGATVGRVANRIAGGRFTLDGRDYQVPTNNGANALHGGVDGFDRRNWEIVSHETGKVVLRLVSADGDQGFPGKLVVTATYAIADNGSLSVDYEARSDRPTIVNLSNHAYWNLAGEGSSEGAMGHLLTIPADHYLPTDGGSIPTGQFRSVEGTVFDFRAPRAIGDRVRDAFDDQIRIGRGYDHCWAVAREPAKAPRCLARLDHPPSGRAMEIWSDRPGVQFYSGNFLDGTSAGKSGRLYRMGDCVVLEPQDFPDTPNQPSFGSIRLEPGEVYRHRIAWHFFTS